jgi:hypothetical protein
MSKPDSGTALTAERRNINSEGVTFYNGDDIINDSTKKRTEDNSGYNVRTLPEHRSGRLLGEGSDLVPSQDNKMVFLASVEGCIHQKSDIMVNDSDGEPYAGGARIKEEGNRFVLYDKNHTPLVLCVHESGHAYNTYNIFGRSPIFPARDIPGAEKDGISFFPQFRIREINFGRPHLAYRSIMAWNGGHFEPMWRAYP